MGHDRGRHRVRGPPGTSAPTMFHAPCPHPCLTPCPHHGRARRPRRAAPTGTHTGHDRGRHRARGPPGTSAPTMPTPCPMVGRDVLGAPRPRGRTWDTIGDAIGYAGRRGRRPLPCSTPPVRTHASRPVRTMVGRDVPGAPRPRERTRDMIGDAIGHAGRRGRRPLPCLTPRPYPWSRPVRTMVGRDVLGAPHPRGRTRDMTRSTHGT